MASISINKPAFYEKHTAIKDTLLAGGVLAVLYFGGKKLDVIKLPKLDLTGAQAVLGTLLSYSGFIVARQACDAYTQSREDYKGVAKWKTSALTAGLALIVLGLTAATQIAKVRSVLKDKFVAPLNNSFAISMAIAAGVSILVGLCFRPFHPSQVKEDDVKKMTKEQLTDLDKKVNAWKAANPESREAAELMDWGSAREAVIKAAKKSSSSSSTETVSAEKKEEILQEINALAKKEDLDEYVKTLSEAQTNNEAISNAIAGFMPAADNKDV